MICGRSSCKPWARRFLHTGNTSGPDNVRSEDLSRTVWNINDDRPTLSEEEFEEVVSLVRSVVRKHGTVNPDLSFDDIDFFILEEGKFDRTVLVEVANFVRFWAEKGSELFSPYPASIQR